MGTISKVDNVKRNRTPKNGNLQTGTDTGGVGFKAKTRGKGISLKGERLVVLVLPKKAEPLMVTLPHC
ncbi:MAG: hypothetical protein JRJ21_11740 [Deltaproteobacteria bacterium]|nr:hypothetical protein [Deltaproteobacteria bacterium]